MLHRPLGLAATLALSTAGCATTTEEHVARGIEADQAQIQESLSGMDRDVGEELIQRRLDLVAEEGISGLAEDAVAPQPGETAPGFALTPIRIYDFQLADHSGATAGRLYDAVRLSDFRGKPVVLIFGSYT